MASFIWDGGNFPFEAIFANAAPFKILLKTKDDPWFIRRWFEHHRAICGAENIVIFDDRSSHPGVLDFYREISTTTHVIHHRVHMDHLHHTDLFPGLYGALAKSCRRFCFLDTDEFLGCLKDEQTLMKPEDIVRLSPAFNDDRADYWPGLWLHNAFKSEHTFWLSGGQDLCNNVQWGKPILSTRHIPNGVINHNIQVAKLTRNVAASSPFIIFHAKDLLPEQRIAAGMKKLATFNYIDGKTRPEDVRSIDLRRGRYGNPTAWIEDIARLLDIRDAPAQTGAIRIENGRISVRDGHSATALTALYRNARAACSDCGLLEDAA